jgi:hypothetical protein
MSKSTLLKIIAFLVWTATVAYATFAYFQLEKPDNLWVSALTMLFGALLATVFMAWAVSLTVVDGSTYFAIKINGANKPPNYNSTCHTWNFIPEKTLGFSHSKDRSTELARLFATEGEDPQDWILAEAQRLTYFNDGKHQRVRQR